MSNLVYQSVQFVSLISIAISLTIVLYLLGVWWLKRRSVYRWYRGLQGLSVPNWLRKGLGIRSAGHPSSEELQFLLRGAGIRLHVVSYQLYKRVVQIVAVLPSAALILLHTESWGLSRTEELAVHLLAIIVLLSTWLDRWMLESMKKRRSMKIARELHQVSQHLLYYEGSKLHLHTKLMRCTSFTTIIRNEWHQLLNDWYYSAEDAMTRFKRQLGTNEAYQFTETLKAMYIQDSQLFYQLLRERIEDTKEKGILQQDEEKEAKSYVLFVLAGLPILNTFRIFLYPWVQEGQRILNSLNS
ncbi:hypothetical protein [Marinicrinis sediminis]|uniref:Uncharacterized protein n=1 Tax=Marinicrinis sediminis TaxID=1652465 RepID=A0ABW5RBX7_9BACL